MTQFVPTSAQDYHRLPASDKQLGFARRIAAAARLPLPDDVLKDRHALSRWIDNHRSAMSAPRSTPSSRQVAFAERIARLKRMQVPDACFRDRTTMSRWIDSHK